MRQKNPSIIRALSDDPSVVERFWTNVSRTDAADDCWEWSGYVRHGGYPTFCVRQFAVRAAHVAWFTHTGELPAVGRVIQTCANHRCVRPSHLAWSLGRAAERNAVTMNDGYVALVGTPFAAAVRAANEPRVFRLIPSSDKVPAPEAA